MTVLGSPPVRIDAGRICLDLAAQPPDRADALDRWLHAEGLVPGATPLHGLDARWVVRFRELGDCVTALVRAQLQGAGPDPAALDRLNALAAAAAPPALRAVRTETGSLVRVLSGEPECRALLAAVARDAVDLLTDPVARALLRQCESGDCHRCYLDTSRGHRRRWCSSEVCGNRERVARHRRRHPVKGPSEIVAPTPAETVAPTPAETTAPTPAESPAEKSSAAR